MPAPAFDAILPAPFCAVGVRVANEQLTGLEFLPADTPLRMADSPLIHRVAAELTAYYSNPAHRFDLPLAPVGSPFRRRVWQALMEIPAGLTLTYGELAQRVGSSPRAVGQALGDNPLPIVIPCHRVVAASGIGGFNHDAGGFALTVKRWLLTHERAWR